MLAKLGILCVGVRAANMVVLSAATCCQCVTTRLLNLVASRMHTLSNSKHSPLGQAGAWGEASISIESMGGCT
jgi:hypothetical protein